MNLELIDPFGRHVPDRIDSTYNLPKDRAVVPLCCSFNRRGMYLGVVYDDNTIAVFSCLSRSVAALYQYCPCSYYESEPTNTTAITSNTSNTTITATTTTTKTKTSPSNASSPLSPQQQPSRIESSRISWSRRSRRMLVGSPGERCIRWIDTTHPLGPELASESLWQEATDSSPPPNNTNPSTTAVAGNGSTIEPSQTDTGPVLLSSSTNNIVVPPTHTRIQTQASSFQDEEDRKRVHVKTNRLVKLAEPSDEPIIVIKQNVVQGNPSPPPPPPEEEDSQTAKINIYSTLEVLLPFPLKNSLQAIDDQNGLAVLENGSLLLLTIDSASFRQDGPDVYHGKTLVKTNVLCAAHDTQRLFVATLKNGLIVYSLTKKHKDGRMKQTDRYGLEHHAAQITDCTIRRNKLLFNGKDGILRLYDTNKIDEGPVLFQDVVTKTKFTCMGISGDGEYVVAAVNQFANTKYGIYIWDAVGGRLVDKLTGSGTSVQYVECHPTRPMIAVACGDGMIDIWGTRVNWTAFAPDFQALPANVEYIEREDEFDVDLDGQPCYVVPDNTQEDRYVNVTTIEPVPAFASDSEEEDQVFDFAPRVKNVIAVKGQKSQRNVSNQDD